MHLPPCDPGWKFPQVCISGTGYLKHQGGGTKEFQCRSYPTPGNKGGFKLIVTGQQGNHFKIKDKRRKNKVLNLNPIG